MQHKRATSLSATARAAILVLAWTGVGCGDNIINSGDSPDASVPADAPEPELDASVDASVDAGIADTEAPGAAVDFPPAVSFTDAPTVSLRGTATDDVAVAAVRVAGVVAQSDDGFATWTADVPVAYGRQTLTVEAEDSAGNIAASAASIEVIRSDVTGSKDLITTDPAGGRAFVIDASAPFSAAILDFATGAYTIVSSDTVGTGATFSRPSQMTYDAVGDQLLVTDGLLDAVVAIAIATGDRTIVADAVTGAGPALLRPRGIAVDAAGQSAYIADRDADAVVAVNLATGDRTVVSDNSGTYTGPSFTSPNKLALDEAGARILVLDGTDRILSVDMATGNRATLSDSMTGSGPQFDFIIDLVYDSSSDRLLANDEGLVGVLAVDGQSGNRTLVQQVLPGAELGYVIATDLAYDADNDRLLLAVDGASYLLAANLADGTLARGDAIGVGAGIPYYLSGQVRLVDNGTDPAYLLTLRGGEDSHRQVVVRTDIATGDRSILSDGEVGMDTFQMPQDVHIESSNNATAYMLAGEEGELSAIDTSTGARTPLFYSGFDEGATAAAYEASDSLLYLAGEGTIVAYNSGAGTSAIISGGEDDIGGGDNLGFVNELVVDSPRSRLLALVPFPGDELVAINLMNGFRSTIELDPSGTMGYAANDIQWLVGSEELYIADRANRAITSLDLSTGVATVHADASTGTGLSVLAPRSLTLDLGNQRIYYFDRSVAAIVVIDLVSGHRVGMSL